LNKRPGIKIPIFLLIFCFLVSISASVPQVIFAQSVHLVKMIQLKTGTGKKGIGSFLLGRKKQITYKPGSICCLGDNLLCVTDAVNSVVIIIDKAGEIKKRITGFKGGQLISPVGCCSDEKGNLFISDSYLCLVLKFNSRYKLDQVFINESGSRITGIQYSRGSFYCVDTKNHRILCYNREGKLEFTFGSRGGGDGEFNFPTHIALGNDYIYITDALNFRVQVFDRSGKFIRRFGSLGRGGGNFSKPKGLALDQEKRIFVADAMFDNVQLFNTEGEFLYYFGGPGHGSGEFWMPSDVLVDRDNLIWVADTYNSRIQVFRLNKEAP